KATITTKPKISKLIPSHSSILLPRITTKPFPYTTLFRSNAAEEVVRNLQNLHGLDFVFPAAQDPELMYSFKHALTQDVVYGGLLDRKSTRLNSSHGRISYAVFCLYKK